MPLELATNARPITSAVRRSITITAAVAAATCIAAGAAHATTMAAGEPPLAAGEMLHTYAVTFDPGIHAPKGLPMMGGAFDEVPRSVESWFDARGRGQQLGSTGASSIHHAPFVTRDHNGHIVGVGGNSQLRPGTTRATSLLYADTVNLLAWPSGGTPFQRAWVRTKSGYEKSYDAKMRDNQPVGVRMGWLWGTSPYYLAKLPRGGAPLFGAVRRLIEVGDPGEGYGVLPTGARGETVDSRSREAHIDRAIRMLGSAPLSEQGRRAVIQWLVTQPGAQVHRGSVDRSGRRGTSVTFSRVFDRAVAARTITAADLVAGARAAGVAGLPDTTSTKQWDVPAHREYRRWLVGIVYESAGAQLLQSYSLTQASFPVAEPQLIRNYSRKLPGEKAYQFELTSGSSSTGSGALLWGVHERVTAIKPVTPVCSRHPETCR